MNPQPCPGHLLLLTGLAQLLPAKAPIIPQLTPVERVLPHQAVQAQEGQAKLVLTGGECEDALMKGSVVGDDRVPPLEDARQFGLDVREGGHRLHIWIGQSVDGRRFRCNEGLGSQQGMQEYLAVGTKHCQFDDLGPRVDARRRRGEEHPVIGLHQVVRPSAHRFALSEPLLLEAAGIAAERGEMLPVFIALWPPAAPLAPDWTTPPPGLEARHHVEAGQLGQLEQSRLAHIEKPEPVRLFQPEVTGIGRTSGLEVATMELRLGYQVRREIVDAIARNPRACRSRGFLPRPLAHGTAIAPSFPFEVVLSFAWFACHTRHSCSICCP